MKRETEAIADIIIGFHIGKTDRGGGMVAHPQTTIVRIVVFGREEAALTTQNARSPGEVLERLGDQAGIEIRTVREDIAKDLAPETLDLIVLDTSSLAEDEALRCIDRLSRVGPPVLAVLGEQDDEFALRVFRIGADQCVCAGPDFEPALCESALELIHDWQATRERSRVARHVEWLEGLNDAIVNRLPAALMVVGPDDRLLSANPEATQLLSRTESQALGRDYRDVIPEALVRDAALADLIATARRGEPAPSRRARLRDGARLKRAYDVQVQTLDDEGRVLLVMNDVTAGERQALRIDELQRYNAKLIQNMNSALLVIDEAQQVQFANPMAEQLFAAATGTLRGRRLADLFAPEDPGTARLFRGLETGERIQGLESSVAASSGRTRPVAMSASPMQDAPGRTRGAVIVLQDLSEIKQLERQVAQSEKMASIGQLAAGVAHEINNPVGFIHANLFQQAEYLDDLDGVFEALETLQRTIEEKGDRERIEAASATLRTVAEKIDLDYVRADLRKAVEESREGTERIRHIVRDLRGFSRADDERMARADINECIESTANIVWTMTRHSVALERDFGELPRLRCRPMQIKQVILNLLMNACQAVGERGDDPSRPGRVCIRTRSHEGGIEIEIEDNGMGISAEHQARIFEPFFTTKEVGQGTGLGLSTSYGIIEKHGGRIRVSSDPGIGTTFTIFLPEGPKPEASPVIGVGASGSAFSGSAG